MCSFRRMFRLAAFLFVVTLLGALFAPRRYRVIFWLGAAAAVVYTLLRLAGLVGPPTPAGVAV